MPLTDTALRNLKPGEKPFKKFDSKGLFIQVTPAGSKLWRMKYRFDGREKLLSFGDYPLVSLKLAREKRDEARLLLLDNKDPAQVWKMQKWEEQRARAITFRSVADEYLAKLEKEGRAPQTMKKTRWLLSFTEADLGKLPISQIEAPDVLTTLRRVESKGNHESARRLRSTIGSVFKYAIATGRATNDPTEALKGALIRPNVKPRAAILERKKLGKLLRDIDRFDGQPTTRIALQLMALLAPRPGELRLSEWKEFDLDAKMWRLPAERMKMRRPHRAPLPARAVELLTELHAHSGTSQLLFPSTRSWVKPISENTMNAALRRMGYSSDEMTAHGFRAVFSTIANESGLWHADAIERALAHVDDNDVRRAYVRGEHWEERVRMAEWWAKELSVFKIMADK